MSVPPSSSSSLPQMAAGPAQPQSRADQMLTKLVSPTTKTRPNSLFRLMNPELFIERTAKISPAAWLVTGMFAFAAATIGYTQWEYSQTTQKVVEAAAKSKSDAKQIRKAAIRKEIEQEEAIAAARRG